MTTSEQGPWLGATLALLLAVAGCGTRHAARTDAPSAAPAPVAAAAPIETSSVPPLPPATVGPADLAWTDLDRLRADADRLWSQGRRLEALLALEHALDVVCVVGVSEEGGHDYAVHCRVTELADGGDLATLAAVRRDPARFPFAAQWVEEVLGQRPELRRRLEAARLP